MKEKLFVEILKLRPQINFANFHIFLRKIAKKEYEILIRRKQILLRRQKQRLYENIKFASDKKDEQVAEEHQGESEENQEEQGEKPEDIFEDEVAFGEEGWIERYYKCKFKVEPTQEFLTE